MRGNIFHWISLTIFLFLSLFWSINLVYATTAGPNNPDTNINDSSIGTITWTNRDNDKTSNNQWATTVSGSMNADTATVYLKATDFDFAIPAGVIIDGISVAVEKKASETSFFDNAIRIVKDGVVGTTDKSNSDAWPISDATSVYGGPADLWEETWTATDINSTDFGFAISVKKVGGVDNKKPSIDWINITVTYHTPIPLAGSMVAPIAGVLATTTLALQATATSSDYGVDKVEFYIDDDVLMGSTSTSDGDDTYTVSWTPEDKGLASGEHYIFAKLYDLASNSTTTPPQLLNVDVTMPISTGISYNPSGVTRDDVTATLTTNRPVRLDGAGEASTTLTYLFTDNGSYTFNYVDEVGHSGSTIATVSYIDRTTPIISGVSPVSLSSVGDQTVLTFSSSEFNDPSCQVDGLNWGSPCNGSTFAAIPGWGNVPEGSFTLTIRDTDLAGNTGTIDTIYIKDTKTAPVITVLGSNPLDLTVGDTFTDPGATALDAVDGSVVATSSGSVDTNIVGTYTIVYTAEDSVHNIATTTRTIKVNSAPVPTAPVLTGGHGGGGGGRTSGYIAPVITPPVIVPTGGGAVLGTSTFRFLKNLSRGMEDNDVRELQLRLTTEGYFKVAPTGYFGPKTLLAVKSYQQFHNLPSTGYFGPLTRALMNDGVSDENSAVQINRLFEQLKSIQNLLNAYLSLPKN